VIKAVAWRRKKYRPFYKFIDKILRTAIRIFTYE
jgi:hypothetical protein